VKAKNLTMQLCIAAALLSGVSACNKADNEKQLVSAHQAEMRVSNETGNTDNQVLVQFKAGTTSEGRSKALAAIGGSLKQHLQTRAMARAGNTDGIYLLELPGKATEAISRIKSLAEIEIAEPNYLLTADFISNDTYFLNSSLWGTYGASSTPANTFGSNASTAWANGHIGSSNVMVGIVDEGIDYTHPELTNNVWTNPYDWEDGIDNDGNGYIDDIHGWDFNANNNTIFDGSSDDHGTHVAGTIGATGGNAAGCAGMAWNVTMISAKFLGINGGSLANAILAIDYITDMKTLHSLNIIATNNSWGGGGFSQLMKDAIDRANNQKILFIAAAGNNGSNNDIFPAYPASYTSSNIISVAAITSTGGLAGFSNYGKTSVDIAAPGAGIVSTLPYGTYGSYNGTSMAAPHVTGAAVLYATTHPGSTPAMIKTAILNAATKTTSVKSKCVTGGRLNVSTF
jgi:subtilisin family serine protease